MVFEREARELQSSHSLHHTPHCQKFSNTQRIYLSLIAYSFVKINTYNVTNTQLTLRTRTQVRNELESLGIDSMTPTSLESLEETRRRLMKGGGGDDSSSDAGNEIDEEQLRVLKEHIEAMLSD